jgi:hypothetical protein
MFLTGNFFQQIARYANHLLITQKQGHCLNDVPAYDVAYYCDTQANQCLKNLKLLNWQSISTKVGS